MRVCTMDINKLEVSSMNVSKFKLSEDPKELEKIDAYLRQQEELRKRSEKAEAESHKRLDPVLKELYLKALRENKDKNE